MNCNDCQFYRRHDQKHSPICQRYLKWRDVNPQPKWCPLLRVIQ